MSGGHVAAGMHTISATEFKATCLGLFDQVYAGAIKEIAITKRGQVVAVLGRPGSLRIGS